MFMFWKNGGLCIDNQCMQKKVLNTQREEIA